MRRLAIAFFYDPHGVVDEYMPYLLQELRKDVEQIFLVANGSLNASGEAALSKAADRLLIRENSGFDAWAYKAALEKIGFDNLAAFDEILLLNHTFYGPIFPFSEMFGQMEGRDCDFWGITAHKEVVPNPFTGRGRLPFHINSQFTAIRRRMFSAPEFRAYWESLPAIESYEASILKHEARFTEHFSKLGYRCSLYMDPERYGSDHAAFIDVDALIEDRCPILKRRLFFHDPIFHNAMAVDLPRALDLIRARSSYDMRLIWSNATRMSELRKLYTNAALLSVLPDSPPVPPPGAPQRVAVCAHVFYPELVPELLAWTNNIPVPYDLIATTDTEEKKQQIEAAAGQSPRIKELSVRVVAQNRGRDMSALFITCRDLFLEDRYDVVCRVHSKKSPQVDTAHSNVFKRHLFENLLDSEGYVANILDIFRREASVGVVVPPVLHLGYPTLGHSWFINRGLAEKLAARLKLQVPFDENTPMAAYGGMFWFRPKALRKLFAERWSWDEFLAEPKPIDGALGHALERLITYAAQDAGYVTQAVMTQRQAARNYVALEYRLQRVSALLPLGTVDGQIALLERMRAGDGIPKGFSLLYLRSRILAKIAIRSPASYRGLRWLYRRFRPRRRFE